MVMYDILTNYAIIAGIQQVFKGMASRASFDSQMEKVFIDLTESKDAFEREFKAFFDELKDACMSFTLQGSPVLVTA